MLRHTAACSRHLACTCVLTYPLLTVYPRSQSQDVSLQIMQAFLSFLLTLCWKQNSRSKGRVCKPGCLLLKRFPGTLRLPPPASSIAGVCFHLCQLYQLPFPLVGQWQFFTTGVFVLCKSLASGSLHKLDSCHGAG